MFNNLKSKKVLNDIFGILKKRKKLKILNHNKRLMNQLNIKLQDFQNYKLLKELNQKFHLEIKDINIKTFNLPNKFLGNDILEYFRIEFKELKEINLRMNKINNIKTLENVNFEKLEFLNLSTNNSK